MKALKCKPLAPRRRISIYMLRVREALARADERVTESILKTAKQRRRRVLVARCFFASDFEGTLEGSVFEKSGERSLHQRRRMSRSKGPTSLAPLKTNRCARGMLRDVID